MKYPALALTALWLASACASTSPAPAAAGADAAPADTSTADSSTADSGAADSSAADSIAADSGTADAGAADSAADSTADASAADVASSNADCTFNADCVAAERCECDEVKGCFCKIGVRGSGKSGVDACKDGNDCETALCVEGPPSTGKFYCSGPCSSASDCQGQLPICSNIAFVGKICIRDPKAP